MAGHSKWKNIQHRKNRQDAAKSKLFAKLAKEIYVAALKGDKTPSNNQRLRLAITKARAYNMPNSNIERIIKKAAGGNDSTAYENIIYEGYGPDGIAVMVETLTSNRNRTAADIRHFFHKYGGNMGQEGCVSWLFKKRGVLCINKKEAEEKTENVEEFFFQLLEKGMEDFEETEEEYEIVTLQENFEIVKEQLEKKGISLKEALITYIPLNKVTVKKENEETTLKLLSALEDYDDTQNLVTNAVFT